MTKYPKKRSFIKVTKWTFMTLLTIILGILITAQFSPWPSALLIRYVFEKAGTASNEKIANLVPAGVASINDINYDSSANNTLLDLYYPSTAGQGDLYPLLVWIHGGGFIGGDKSGLSNYCKILASKGFVVAVPNYTLAPEAKYPIPVRQTNTALNFLCKHAAQYHINPKLIGLAGDSGGAHMVAQLALIISNPNYAREMNIQPGIYPSTLKCVILHCGPYNLNLIDSKKPGWFINTVLWSYTGIKKLDPEDPKMKSFSVSNYITKDFPPAFISVGNKDTLAPHSYDLAQKLSAKGVIVDSLFFPKNYLPELQHEYQFDLHGKAAQQALQNTLKFLKLWMIDGNH